MVNLKLDEADLVRIKDGVISKVIQEFNVEKITAALAPKMFEALMKQITFANIAIDTKAINAELNKSILAEIKRDPEYYLEDCHDAIAKALSKVKFEVK